MVRPSANNTVVSVLSMSNDNVTSSPPANSAAPSSAGAVVSVDAATGIAMAIDAATTTPLMCAKALSPLLIYHSPFSLR